MTNPSALPAVPPTIDELRTAIASLPHARPRACALHLALPVDAVAGIDAHFDGTAWRWRDVVVPESGDPVADAATLVAAGARPDDRFLDLTDAPWTWVKVLRSGLRSIAYGLDFIHGGPLVAAEDGVTVDQVRDVIEMLFCDGPIPVPTLVGTGAGAVIVDGTASSWVLRAQHVTPEPPIEPAAGLDVEELAAIIAGELAATAVDTAYLGSRRDGTLDVEFVCTLPDGWEAIVPATVSERSEMLGVPARDIGAPADTGDVPDGYTLLGTSRFEPGVLVADAAAGYRVLLRRP